MLFRDCGCSAGSVFSVTGISAAEAPPPYLGPAGCKQHPRVELGFEECWRCLQLKNTASVYFPSFFRSS